VVDGTSCRHHLEAVDGQQVRYVAHVHCGSKCLMMHSAADAVGQLEHSAVRVHFDGFDTAVHVPPPVVVDAQRRVVVVDEPLAHCAVEGFVSRQHL
jgi:hypothetical protein